MGLLKKKSDPISERSRSLNAEIAALEQQIQQLNSRLAQAASQPRLRSTTLPPGHAAPPAPPPPPRETIFEAVDHQRVKSPSEPENTPGHFNDLGVRKYDFAAAWRRFLHHFRGPPANNPKLVSYLAAGSIQGLRPMRYEKRVARNRLIGLAVILFVVLYGIARAFLKR